MVLFLLVSSFVVTPLELRLTPPTAVYQVSTSTTTAVPVDVNHFLL